jgi:(1->4)-alpha-D-glucan 1-alpha-D-glucosylmutase
MSASAIPLSTYRLQFNASFTFAAAAAIVDYLDALGITHCYASNYFMAVPGSTHGYDVADPTRLNPEVGDESQYRAWIAALRARGMGHIVDLVPNHMGIARSANPWWQDVLENGASSRYANVFDIDWHPLKQELENKVLLPILGGPYGTVLERQEIQLEYRQGAFAARYLDIVLPIAPGTYDQILGRHAETLLAAIDEHSDAGIEFLSILSAIRHLPSREAQDPALIAERDREKEVIKRRLAALTAHEPRVMAYVERVVAELNGVRGEPHSFDPLDELLSGQPYRLSYWRVAAEEINYRRFFDINELAAIRMEDPEVFALTHAFAFDLVKEGYIDGFRIDHVDGLYDPAGYLRRMQQRAQEVSPDRFSAERPLYVVAEKILALDERLPDWPIEGTTGYDFLARVSHLFVDQRNERAMDVIYERFTRMKVPFQELAYRGKQLVLRMSMASELNVLASQLNRFSERSRHYRDFTLNSLVYAMREIISSFPVYRTYVNERDDVCARDRAYIEQAVREAKRRNPRRPGVVFDFVRDLLLKKADYIPPSEREEHVKFVGKFQQVTSPVTAKGLEDTAFYIYNRLVSLNEVGGAPDRFGSSPDTLHAWMSERATRWPHGLSASSTHDTKRSEDVRARLNVLSELPGAWKQAISRWARTNRRGRTMLDGDSYPSRNEEYLLYQTLVGSWPLDPMSRQEEATYVERITAYMLKAMREAKVFTSWLNPSEPHEQAMIRFVHAVLSPENVSFRSDFVEFQGRVARWGLYNSLAQLAVKVGAPGVPDFYQGTEVWNFSLVDPDNRHAVDYEQLTALLSDIDAMRARADPLSVAASLLAAPSDPRLKLFTTAMMLRARKARRDLFDSGTYEGLAVEGARRENVFAFLRSGDAGQLLIAVPRLITSLIPDPLVPPTSERIWGDTRIVLPGVDRSLSPDGQRPACYTNLMTGTCVSVRSDEGQRSLRAADVFEHFPVGILEGTGAR